MTFEEYEKAAVSTAIYPGRKEPLGLMYVALKMNGEAGEFAEHIGKAIRDEGYANTKTAYNRDFDGTDLGTHNYVNPYMSRAKKELLMKELGDVLWYIAAGANELGTDLATIAQMNIDKLAKRQAEGKLGGSGDER